MEEVVFSYFENHQNKFLNIFNTTIIILMEQVVFSYFDWILSKTVIHLVLKYACCFNKNVTQLSAAQCCQ